MTAKQYLNQIRTLDTKIRELENEIIELYSVVTSISADPGREHVDGGYSDNTIDVIIDKKKELCELKTLYALKRMEIVNQIHKLEDDRYITILYKRYVECKQLEVIAVETEYVPGTVRNLHRTALAEFEKVMTQNDIMV